MTANFNQPDPFFGSIDLDDEFITEPWLLDRFVGYQLFTFGDNSTGQLGIGNITSYSSPVQVGSLTNWKQISLTDKSFAGVKTDGTEELVNYPEVIDIADNISSYDDTLALMENLDAVITSCTSVLHASAIAGTKTFALIPISAYFTWVSPPTKGRPHNTSIWYEDNLRLFRQVTPKKWDEPVDELIVALKELVNTK